MTTQRAVRIEPPAEPATRPSLHQRISAITAAVGGITATSRNQYGKPALGIDDVEEALGPLLAEHGVVTEWTYGPDGNSEPLRQVQSEPAPLWMCHLRVSLVNADDAQDRTPVADWYDVGSNPMAATSFARKGWLKATFHLAEAEDEGRPAVRESATGAPPARRQNGGPVRRPLPGHACPECAEQLVAITPEGKRTFVGHETFGPDSCRWKPSWEVQAQWLRELEPAGPVTLVELVATAEQRVRDFAGLDEEACRVILAHHGWDGTTKSTDWLRSFTETGPLLALISDLNSAVRDCQAEIP